MFTQVGVNKIIVFYIFSWSVYMDMGSYNAEMRSPLAQSIKARLLHKKSATTIEKAPRKVIHINMD